MNNQTNNVCPLTDFGFLKVSGKDAVSFLQGYTTCDLHALDEDTVQMGAVCNIQGRMLTSFLVISDGQDLILRMSRDLIAATIEFLSKYIVFSKAELSDISEQRYCFGLPEASQQPAGNLTRQDASFIVHLGNRSELWLPAAEALPDATASMESWRNAEFEAGVVWVSNATTEKFLPQMFNYHMLDAIDFEKGCYLGQEIVARMQYRGELKRKLHRLTSVGSREVGDPVTNGEIVATTGRDHLAVIQNPAEDPITVRFDDGEAAVATLVE
jgi:folate-binding protein YgfZ